MGPNTLSNDIKVFMKAILASLIFLISATSQAADTCYTGRFSVGFGKIQLKYVVTNTNLHVEVLNPDDLVTLSSGETKTVRQAFDPGPDMKLIPMEGVKCPCLALQTEKGNFTFIVEQLGDRTERLTMDYFGITTSPVELRGCNK